MCVYIYIHIYAYMYMYVYVYTYIITHVCVNIYIYIYTHVYNILDPSQAQQEAYSPRQNMGTFGSISGTSPPKHICVSLLSL